MVKRKFAITIELECYSPGPNDPWDHNSGGYIVIRSFYVVASFRHAVHFNKMQREHLRPKTCSDYVVFSEFVTDRKKADSTYSEKLYFADAIYAAENGIECIGVRRGHGTPVRATGTVEFDDDIQPKTINFLLAYALSAIGIGASKMGGFGCGYIVKFEEIT
jgi:hypothetical protein